MRLYEFASIGASSAGGIAIAPALTGKTAGTTTSTPKKKKKKTESETPEIIKR